MKRHPSTFIHPGEIFLEFVFTPLKITAKELSELIKVPQEDLVKFIEGDIGITSEIAKGIERELGGKADFWIRMQRKYDKAKKEALLAKNSGLSN